MHPNQTDRTAEIAMRLLHGNTAIPVSARLSYDPADPMAVTIEFRTRGVGTVTWTFARDLIADGARTPTGVGDVRVWPARSAEGATISIALSSPSGHALFEGPRDELVAFIDSSYAVVPRGEEAAWLNLDGALKTLLETS
jgi:hypothetical protein